MLIRWDTIAQLIRVKSLMLRCPRLIYLIANEALNSIAKPKLTEKRQTYQKMTMKKVFNISQMKDFNLTDKTYKANKMKGCLWIMTFEDGIRVRRCYKSAISLVLTKLNHN